MIWLQRLDHNYQILGAELQALIGLCNFINISVSLPARKRQASH